MKLPTIPTWTTTLAVMLTASFLGCGDENPTKPPAGGGTTGVAPGAPATVTNLPSSSPDVSPDGAKLAMKLGTGEIAAMPVGGGSLDTLATGIYANGPDWSPDGAKIVVDGGGGLALIDVATKAISALGSGDIDGDPEWSPDGTKIAARTSMGGDGIGITTYPGGAWSILPCTDQKGGGCDGEGPTWAPDGSAIAFEDGLEILRVSSAGGQASVLAEGFDDVTRPSWSPDGKWVAFEAESTGVGNPYPVYYGHIWIVDSRGMSSGMHQITFGPVNDSRPGWSADSKSIYFTSDRGGMTAIWKVVIQP